MSEYAYNEALKREFIFNIRSHVEMWREGNIDAETCMHNIETWVHEIWGQGVGGFTATTSTRPL